MVAGGIIVQSEVWDFGQLSYQNISGNILVGTALIFGGLSQIFRH